MILQLHHHLPLSESEYERKLGMSYHQSHSKEKQKKSNDITLPGEWSKFNHVICLDSSTINEQDLRLGFWKITEPTSLSSLIIWWFCYHP